MFFVFWSLFFRANSYVFCRLDNSPFNFWIIPSLSFKFVWPLLLNWEYFFVSSLSLFSNSSIRPFAAFSFAAFSFRKLDNAISVFFVFWSLFSRANSYVLCKLPNSSFSFWITPSLIFKFVWPLLLNWEYFFVSALSLFSNSSINPFAVFSLPELSFRKAAISLVFSDNFKLSSLLNKSFCSSNNFKSLNRASTLIWFSLAILSRFFWLSVNASSSDLTASVLSLIIPLNSFCLALQDRPSASSVFLNILIFFSDSFFWLLVKALASLSSTKAFVSFFSKPLNVFS